MENTETAGGYAASGMGSGAGLYPAPGIQNTTPNENVNLFWRVRACS